MNRKGFTLIEMMIVVAIIAILVAIALPNMVGARKTANEKAVLAELRTIGTALETYYIRENEYPDKLNVLVENDLLPDVYKNATTGTFSIPGRRYQLNIVFDTSNETYNILATPTNTRFGGKCYRVTTGGTLEQADYDGTNCNNWETI